jgi:hypothetical protein
MDTPGGTRGALRGHAAAIMWPIVSGVWSIFTRVLGWIFDKFFSLAYRRNVAWEIAAGVVDAEALQKKRDSEGDARNVDPLHKYDVKVFFCCSPHNTFS